MLIAHSMFYSSLCLDISFLVLFATFRTSKRTKNVVEVFKPKRCRLRWKLLAYPYFKPLSTSFPSPFFIFLSFNFHLLLFLLFYRQVVKSDGVKEEGELLQTRNGERMKRSNFFLLMAKGFSSAFAATHNRRGGQFHQHFTSNFFHLKIYLGTCVLISEIF